MILFVDDEPARTETTVDALIMDGIDVHYKHDTDEALKFLKENLGQIELLILDVMMPPGTAFAGQDTNLGLRTGIRFYEKARVLKPDLPVIVLTNVTDPKVAKHFGSEKNCLFREKWEVPATELGSLITEFLSKSNSVPGEER